MSESLSTLRDLLSRVEFRTGLVLGTIALTLLAGLAIVRTPGWMRPWGLAASAATLVGVQLVDDRRLGLNGGVVLMAIGGALVGMSADTRSSHLWKTSARFLGWPIIATGALLIPLRGQVEEDDWYFVVTPVVAIAMGVALSAWTRRTRTSELGALFAITTFAVWTTVPDTELARLLLGVSLPLALATLRPISASLTSAGSFALAGVFAWIPALDGEGRPASIIGAWACMGMIVIVPLADAVWPKRPPARTATLFAFHAGIVVIAARVIGLWSWAVAAAGASILLYVAALALLHRLDRVSLASGGIATRR